MTTTGCATTPVSQRKSWTISKRRTPTLTPCSRRQLKLQDELYGELIGRIKQDDASVPVLRKGWWYYTRYETGREYPVDARRYRSMSAPEQVTLDGNALASGESFFQIGTWAVSPNGRMLAYAEDT